MDQFVDPGSFEAALDQTVDNALHQMRRRGEAFFFFQAEDGIRDWRDWSSDVCSSDLAVRTDEKQAVPDVEVVEAAALPTFANDVSWCRSVMTAALREPAAIGRAHTRAAFVATSVWKLIMLSSAVATICACNIGPRTRTIGSLANNTVPSGAAS